MPHLAVALMIRPYPRQKVDERRIFLYFHFYYTADALVDDGSGYFKDLWVIDITSVIEKDVTNHSQQV